jgi:hypothetical protein
VNEVYANCKNSKKLKNQQAEAQRQEERISNLNAAEIAEKTRRKDNILAMQVARNEAWKAS